jgi:hypothetical protein
MNWRGKMVALVGRMVANSGALGQLKTGLEAQGATARALLGDGKGVLTVTDEQLRVAITGADIAVIGMGHPENVAGEERRAAALCAELGVPYFLYADNPAFGGGVFRRPWFGDALSDAVGVFVPKATDADDAKTCMPRLRAIATGNPTHEDMGRVGMPHEEAKEKYGVESRESVMLVSFTKDPKLNREIAAAAIGAAATRWMWRVFLCLHPGDPSYAAEYSEFVDSAPENVKVVIAISPKAQLAFNEKHIKSDPSPIVSAQAGYFHDGWLLVEATESLVDAADVIIDPTGSAMVARSAMHRPDHSIRVITVFTPDGLKRAGLTRAEDAEFAKDGTAPTVMTDGLAETLVGMMVEPECFAPYCNRQHELYGTPPPKGTAVARMITALEQYLEDRVTKKALEGPECGTCGFAHG